MKDYKDLKLERGRVAKRFLDELLAMPREKQVEVLGSLDEDELSILVLMLEYDYDLMLLPHQREPEGDDWRWWVLLSGRGAGKTHAGSAWITKHAMSGKYEHIACVAPTWDTFRKVMLNGASGLKAIAPPWFKPAWEPSKNVVKWPNGVTANIFSAEKPERLRGSQYELIWIEELAAWPNLESFDQIDLGLRLGKNPRGFISTTPKPRGLILDLVLGPKINNVRVPRHDVYVTKVKSEANTFLDPKVFAAMRDRFGASRFGRQEMDAELLERTGRELFLEEQIEANRVNEVPRLVKVIVAVDPTRANDPKDEAGIIVIALGEDQHAYVLADCSVRASPLGWATAAIGAYNRYRADTIVYEKNRLGEKTEQTLRVLDRSVKWQPVVASDGKVLRAEPVSALHEQGRVHMVGHFQLLEDELTSWEPEYSTWSPNRLDAFVWGVTALLLDDAKTPLVAL